jgi:hypothetical protein
MSGAHESHTHGSEDPMLPAHRNAVPGAGEAKGSNMGGGAGAPVGPQPVQRLL